VKKELIDDDVNSENSDESSDYENIMNEQENVRGIETPIIEQNLLS